MRISRQSRTDAEVGAHEAINGRRILLIKIIKQLKYLAHVVFDYFQVQLHLVVIALNGIATLLVYV